MVFELEAAMLQDKTYVSIEPDRPETELRTPDFAIAPVKQSDVQGHKKKKMKGVGSNGPILVPMVTPNHTKKTKKHRNVGTAPQSETRAKTAKNISSE